MENITPTYMFIFITPKVQSVDVDLLVYLKWKLSDVKFYCLYINLHLYILFWK